MKRFFITLVVLCSLSTFAFSMEATVISVSGKVEIQKNDKWIALSKGDTVKNGNVISTGFKSEAILKIGESTVTVKPLSRLTLEQISNLNGNHKSQVYLDVGSIKADVKASTDKKVGFTIKSPVATASVRGTDFEFSGEKLIVNRGVVAISKPLPKQINTSAPSVSENQEINQEDLNVNGRGSQILAKAGQSIEVNSNGNFNTPQTVAAASSLAIGNGTQTLFEQEKNTALVSVPSSILTTSNTSKIKKSTGNIVITPIWPSAAE